MVPSDSLAGELLLVVALCRAADAELLTDDTAGPPVGLAAALPAPANSRTAAAASESTAPGRGRQRSAGPSSDTGSD